MSQLKVGACLTPQHRALLASEPVLTARGRVRAARVVPGSQVSRYEQYPSPSQWVEGAVPAFMRQGDAVAVDRSSMHGTKAWSKRMSSEVYEWRAWKVLDECVVKGVVRRGKAW